MKSIYSGIIGLLLLGVVFIPNAHAETTTSVNTMLEQIKALMAKVEELQKQLTTIRGEVSEAIKAGLVEGTTDEDVKKIQELLATDTTIYPEGKVTGYFGPLTKEAIKRFQVRHELEVTGVIDEDTRALFKEYLAEKHDGKIPPGLLRAPGIEKKIEMRYEQECDDSGKGKSFFCNKLKMKYKLDDDKKKLKIENESDDDIEDEDEDDGDDD